jgi:hypothetical protein
MLTKLRAVPRVARLAGAGLLLAALGSPAVADAHGKDNGGPGLSITTVSNPRPNLVSGGDVLTRVDVPAGLDARRVGVRLNGADVTSAFARQPDGTLLGRVEGLKDGRNLLSVRASGGRYRSDQLTVVNHSITGPVFSGRQQQPFYCETTSFGLPAATPPLCSAPTQVTYQYRTTGGTYKPWPLAGAPAQPYPADLATTTVDGRPVPFIVRLEQGTIDRGVYQIAALYDGRDPSPQTGDRNWNGRLVYTFGGGCNAGYHQGTATAGVLAPVPGPNNEDIFLGRGYAVATNTLNLLDQNCSIPISAEAAMMTKEHFADEYGPIVHTIGWGGSGGAIQQYGIADMYPGILDGIVPGASFPNANGTVLDVVSDCRLLDRYFAATPGYSAEQQTAVSGFGYASSCPSWDSSFANRIQATASCAPSIPATVPGDPNTRWDATTNPDGVRCAAAEQLVNQLGVDPRTGFVNTFHDNTGIQYGLAALDSGAITAGQFADLNAKVGGFDYTGEPAPQRSAASPIALQAMYADDLNVSGALGLQTTPIIDQRGYQDPYPGNNIHTAEWSFVLRARLEAAGKADNQVIIEHDQASGEQVSNTNAYELSAMEQWLNKIAADGSRAPVKVKIGRDKPAGLADGCFLDDAQTSPTLQPGGLSAAGRSGPCESRYPVFANTRLAAGQPEDLYALKCALKPIDWRDYPVAFTDEQKAQLRSAFPNGVCNYRRPGPLQQPPIGAWLDYSFGTTPFSDDRPGAA